MQKKVFQLLTDNTSGVLSRISGLFSRRGYNIESITAGVTADPRYSRITIVASGDDEILEQIEKQLNKKLDVIKVKTFDETSSISRELILVKVKYNKNTRGDILEIVEMMTEARIVDCSKNQMVIQMCDLPEKNNLLITLLQPAGIIEVVRTGTLAVQKCSE